MVFCLKIPLMLAQNKGTSPGPSSTDLLTWQRWLQNAPYFNGFFLLLSLLFFGWNGLRHCYLALKLLGWGGTTLRPCHWFVGMHSGNTWQVSVTDGRKNLAKPFKPKITSSVAQIDIWISRLPVPNVSNLWLTLISNVNGFFFYLQDLFSASFIQELLLLLPVRHWSEMHGDDGRTEVQLCGAFPLLKTATTYMMYVQATKEYWKLYFLATSFSRPRTFMENCSYDEDAAVYCFIYLIYSFTIFVVVFIATEET